jgi:2-dehydropantoate 2-reductase
MDRILIWGAGAIGGVLGAYWRRGGHDVTLVDIDADHVAACRDGGLSIEGTVEEFRQTVPALTPDEVAGTWPVIVLAVKAQATAGAVTRLAPHLAGDGYVLSAQNGLNEIEIARQLGEARTMGCFVNFGADWHGPGRVLFGNRGAVVVGELDGRILPRTQAMHALMKEFEPDAVLTDNIWGYLWGKLAYGSMLFATALTPDSMSANFADPARFPAWRALGREVLAVAAARGVTPVGFPEFDVGAFAQGESEERMEAAIARLADYTSHGAKTHSGVWRDLAVRKRRTEVDQQIGMIDELGAQAAIDTPAIRTLVRLIHDIEDGRRPQSLDALRELIAIC